MNERIQELLKQAAKLANTEYNKDFDRKFDMIVAEKLAELIVRECVDIAIQVDKNPYLEDHYHARQIIKNINKHFGVEE
jgi:hypothetical protein